MSANSRPSQRAASLSCSIKQYAPASPNLERNSTQHTLQRVSSQLIINPSRVMPGVDNESFYNASRVQSANPTDSSSDKENTRALKTTLCKEPNNSSLDEEANTKDKSATPHLVRFVNRPEGTPLFTIVEQRSLATLRSKASNLTFSIRATQSIISRRTQTEAEIITRGVKAASADDVMYLKVLHENVPPSASSSECLAQPWTHIEPLQPPFSPPFRRTTPKGIDRWPRDTDVPPHLPGHARSPEGVGVRSHCGNGAAVRRRVSGYMRRLFEPQQRPQAPTWRPPVSGHSTIGHAGLDQHPFQSAMIAAVDHATASSHDGVQRRQASQQSSDTLYVSSSLGSSLRANSISAAQRALGALHENGIAARPILKLPVSPHVSTLPNRGIRHSFHHAQQKLQAVTSPSRTAKCPSDTLRTLDLIESFPRPPSGIEPTSPRTLRPPLPLFAPVPQRVPPVTFIQDGGMSPEGHNIPHEDEHNPDYVDCLSMLATQAQDHDAGCDLRSPETRGC